MAWHRRTWQIVELARPGDTPSRVFDVAILALIFLNVVAVILGSVAAVQARCGLFLEVFEVGSVVMFTDWC